MKLELTVLGLCAVGLSLNSRLAAQVRPDLAAPTAMSVSQQEKLEQVASASLFGQFRSNMSDFLWLKVDKYLHRGVDMRGLTKEEREHDSAQRVQNGTAEAGNREHTDETTVVPTARTDWRGVLGDVERDIKPFANMGSHTHRDPREALPLFRLMTWSNPKFIQGYTTGAVMMARQKQSKQQALAFLAEGLRNNPDSVEIEATFAFLLMKGEARRWDEAVDHAERGLAALQKRDLRTLSDDERGAWQDCIRWRVLAYRNLGRSQQAIQAAQEGLRQFPDDATCTKLLKDMGQYKKAL
ncbi:hypothetical protein [Armatimonas rosea]|uniref:Tetratricopeptide repeat protein n=1 Tax=Armatimonas rosea TaxID=685828 RepID=A0A7W9SQM8_ARMRO|nr:hypothetical protein [Armatimonas rosea]MBB6050204.1 hypothetical protein [Armatimonas rosea]